MDGLKVKRINPKLKEKITYSNLYSQYKIVKSNCKNKRLLFLFSNGLNTNLYEIGVSLRNETYKFSRYNIFLIKERKYRIIMAECVSDKIVTHFVVNYCLKPCLEKKLILQNVATRKNLGTKAAYDFFEKSVRKIGYDKKIYALKIDIKKYFYSISHDKLKEMLRKDIKDSFALSLIFKIIDSTDADYVNEKIDFLIYREKEGLRKKYGTESVVYKNLSSELDKVPRYKKGVGLSIGCVINQLLSVYYLNGIDRFAKEELKCKFYVRFMDDIIILNEDKKKLERIFSLITEKITELDLCVNPKSNIYNFNNGFTFLGRTYRISDNKLFSKTKNVTFKGAQKRLKEFRTTDFSKYYLSKASYFGLIEEKFMWSLEDEYEYLKNSYNSCIVTKKNGKYIFDENDPNYLEYQNYLINGKYKNMLYVTYLKKRKKKFIFLQRTTVKFYGFKQL